MTEILSQGAAGLELFLLRSSDACPARVVLERPPCTVLAILSCGDQVYTCPETRARAHRSLSASPRTLYQPVPLAHTFSLALSDASALNTRSAAAAGKALSPSARRINGKSQGGAARSDRVCTAACQPLSPDLESPRVCWEEPRILDAGRARAVRATEADFQRGQELCQSNHCVQGMVQEGFGRTTGPASRCLHCSCESRFPRRAERSADRDLFQLATKFPDFVRPQQFAFIMTHTISRNRF